MAKDKITLAKIKDLTSLNFKPAEHRELCERMADLYGGMGAQDAADAWLMVVAMIAAGKVAPNDEFERRVIVALERSAEALTGYAATLERERKERAANVTKAKGKASQAAA